MIFDAKLNFKVRGLNNTNFSIICNKCILIDFDTISVSQIKCSSIHGIGLPSSFAAIDYQTDAVLWKIQNFWVVQKSFHIFTWASELNFVFKFTLHKLTFKAPPIICSRRQFQIFLSFQK